MKALRVTEKTAGRNPTAKSNRSSDEQQHQRQRREREAPFQGRVKKLLARPVPAKPRKFFADRSTRFFSVARFAAGEKHLNPAKNQKRRQSIQHPVKRLISFHAGGDHRAAHDERARMPQ